LFLPNRLINFTSSIPPRRATAATAATGADSIDRDAQGAGASVFSIPLKAQL
jgi:hypothetical protein